MVIENITKEEWDFIILTIQRSNPQYHILGMTLAGSIIWKKHLDHDIDLEIFVQEDIPNRNTIENFIFNSGKKVTIDIFWRSVHNHSHLYCSNRIWANETNSWVYLNHDSPYISILLNTDWEEIRKSLLPSTLSYLSEWLGNPYAQKEPYMCKILYHCFINFWIEKYNTTIFTNNQKNMIQKIYDARYDPTPIMEDVKNLYNEILEICNRDKLI
jgi:hypothetical protein